MKNLKLALDAVIAGEITVLPIVLSATQQELLDAAAEEPCKSVSRTALIRILKDWRDGHCGANDVQQWASFIRRGYTTGQSRVNLRPIDIPYDEFDEDLIVETLARFDEIGDIIDGEIDDSEQKEMLRALQE